MYLSRLTIKARTCPNCTSLFGLRHTEPCGHAASRTPVLPDYFIHTVHSCKCSDDQSEHSI